MKHIIATAMLISTAAQAETNADNVKANIEAYCSTATYNVMIAYKQANEGNSMVELIQSFPKYKQEILAGYKLYELGKGEYESYVIFNQYCLSVVTGA